MDVIKSYFGSFSKPLLHTFRLSLEEETLPDDLRTAKVSPNFKVSDKNNLVNYRLIFALCCFSKILENIMYKRLFNHLSGHDLLYQKQFDFQWGHATGHAEMQLIDQINNEFENNCFTLDIFIYLSKAFDTGNHQILISKLKNYEREKFKLVQKLSRNQYLNYNSDVTNLLQMKCVIPYASIFGPLSFLIYVDDFCNGSNILDPIMFADDTNLFLYHENVNTLFKIFNEESKRLRTASSRTNYC